MMKKIQSTVNSNTESTTTSVSLNSTTAVTISVSNNERIFFRADNDNNALSFWLRLYPASDDNTKHGIYVSSKTGVRPFWEMPVLDKYRGEISAIADTGSPTAFITEY